MDDKTGLVIDPYCGSGTTLVAAKLLGHNYIGIDISEDYANFSERRLANAISERSTAGDELSKHIVRKTFEERKNNGEFTGRFKPKDEPQIESPRLL